MSTEPQIRAVWGRTVLRRRASFTPDESRAWNERVSSARVARVTSAFPMQWLPASDVLGLVDVSEAVLGPRYVSTGLEHLLEELGRPPYAAILRGIAHSGHQDPRAGVAAAIEVLFATICRNAGSMVVEVTGDHGLEIWHRAPAREFVQSPGYRLAFSYVSLATLAVVGLDGDSQGFVPAGDDLVCPVTRIRPRPAAS